MELFAQTIVALQRKVLPLDNDEEGDVGDEEDKAERIPGSDEEAEEQEAEEDEALESEDSKSPDSLFDRPRSEVLEGKVNDEGLLPVRGS